ncbi:MAG: Hpt domain-containing protein [Winogradskyella sp.]|uniref:Hpt domain-containing protein n=1 Tax=Winogradskyella sp. TaxID=1883156 RepID=UPI0025F2B2C9|nr:Hpt domain-containing protein [Winogradskyella sp.]NRB60287.1 Hpt domain-containing protein [Winogradskyella sp.]
MEEPNLSYVYNMSGGNKEFEQKLIGIMKTEFPEEKKEYFENIAAGNFSEVAKNVHKLKHKIIILGLEKSYALAARYEDNLLKDSVEGKEDFEAVLQNMTKFLDSL